MVMPPAAAMFAADAGAAPFSGMMPPPSASHLPGGSIGPAGGGAGVMMMSADTDSESAGWMSNSSDVASSYLSAKPAHMVCRCCCY